MLNASQLSQITSAIRSAEKMTSGEIRVCVARKCKDNPLDAAFKKFNALKMHETQLRNAVLVYVCPDDHKTAIIGDKGIDEIAKDGFWDSVLREMLEHFKRNDIVEGICQGVGRVGELIKTSYPVADDDINELSDEVILEE